MLYHLVLCKHTFHFLPTAKATMVELLRVR
jgi:hypothetical protein